MASQIPEPDILASTSTGDTCGQAKQLSDDGCRQQHRMRSVDHRWIERYELANTPHDKSIKDRELNSVVRYLQADPPPEHSHYLDVGTCSGRYPLELGKLGLNFSSIAAVDISEAACATTKARIYSARRAGEIRNSPALSVFRFDITSPQAPGRLGQLRFGLVTCMMGTLSHLAAMSPSAWRHAISNMARILAPGGTMVLGLWSERAVRERIFLSLYNDSDRAALAELSPRIEDVLHELARHDLPSDGHTPKSSDHPITILTTRSRPE